MKNSSIKPCSFCNFTNKRKQKVYDGDHVYAIVSTDPINKYHVLVVTKEHYDSLISLPYDVASELIHIVQKLSIAVRNASKADAITHVTEDEVIDNGFNLVKHFKFHIIPRYQKDMHFIDYSPMRVKVTDEELTWLAEEIKNKI